VGSGYRPTAVTRVRVVLVVVLLIVAGAAGTATALTELEKKPVAIGSPATDTPVLSARRVPAVIAAPVADRRLTAALDDLVSRQPGTECLTVTSYGRTIYATNADAPLVPASLQKLVTALAALEVLGPEFRFRTVLVAAAPAVAGVVAGDVWLVGGGDPLLSTADYLARFRHQPQIATSAEALADTLVAAGVTAIDGALLGDESRYDTARYVSAWPARFIAQDQSGPLSALTVNDNWVEFPANPDTSVPDEAPAGDPAAHGAAVVGGLLEARGVSISGSTGVGAAPAGAVELAAIHSPPLLEVLTQLLRESDNQTGELLLKELAVARGLPGTTANGATVAAEVATGLGLGGPGTAVVDGSGLAEQNRQTCAALQAILDRGGAGSPLPAMLSVAGVNGTLDRRFAEHPVAGRLLAKTGTLDQVTALAGYLETEGGARLSFSYVVNLDRPDVVDQPDVDLQTELVEILDRYPQTPSFNELGPVPLAAAD
ncbi:MAG: D-alanyl-D-alanine carboxypeptidase/D-alanyl-D-alanine endopeptidase, partial [Acidimicrobiales bacterium]